MTSVETAVNSSGRERPKWISAQPVLAIVCVVLIALCARLGVYAANYPFGPLLKDDSVYEQAGWNLISGHGFSSDAAAPYDRLAYRGPGYPGFIASVYLFAGRSEDAVRAVQIGVNVIACVLIYLVGTRLLSRSHGLVAAGLYAIHPASAGHSVLLLTESNQALLVLLAVVLAYVCVEGPRRMLPFAGLGAVLGVATLSRPDAQLLIVPLLAAVWFSTGYGLQIGRRLALSAGVFLLVVVPWIASNYYAFDRYIGLASGAGHVAMTGVLEAEGHVRQGLYAELEARYGKAFQEKYGRRMTYIDGAIPDEDALRMRDFVAFVTTRPVRYAKHCLLRLYALWEPRSWSDSVGLKDGFSEYAAGRRRGALALKGALLAGDMVVLACAAIGVVLALRQWRQMLLVLTVLAYVTAIHSVLYAGARYRVPILPLIAILSSQGMLWIWGALGHRAGHAATPEPVVTAAS